MDSHLGFVVGAVAFAVVVLGVGCGGSSSPSGGGSDAASVDATGGDDSSSGTGNDAAGATCIPGCNRRLNEVCCAGQCARTDNDPLNCGRCGIVCSGATPFCDGTCKAAPCTMDGGTCSAGTTCCGTTCCDSTQICCLPNGPIDQGPSCETPTGSPPTCAPGCAPLCISDRNLKRDIVRVDEQAVLDAVGRMPVSLWSYKSDDPSVRHMGPMAQDFSAAFGLGNTDRAYDPIDAHGVAFAAIKALSERIREEQTRIDQIERENQTLRGELFPRGNSGLQAVRAANDCREEKP
jgi:hypothetical protein